MDRQTDTHMRGRERVRERGGERETETERQRDRGKDRDRETEREQEREAFSVKCFSKSILSNHILNSNSPGQFVMVLVTSSFSGALPIPSSLRDASSKP